MWGVIVLLAYSLAATFFLILQDEKKPGYFFDEDQ